MSLDLTVKTVRSAPTPLPRRKGKGGIALAWIYAFRDARYEKGIKIGWEKSSKGNKYIDIAQSYSPAEIVYEAAWEILEEVKGRSGSNKIEERACEGLLSLTFPNNGKEWLDVDVETCLSKVSTNLKTKPTKIILGKYSNYDDFRSPKTIDDPRMTKYKQVFWVYEEHLSGRVKVQRIDDWQTPREQRKRYSRNGFCPVAAFTMKGRLHFKKTWPFTIIGRPSWKNSTLLQIIQHMGGCLVVLPRKM